LTSQLQQASAEKDSLQQDSATQLDKKPVLEAAAFYQPNGWPTSTSKPAAQHALARLPDTSAANTAQLKHQP